MSYIYNVENFLSNPIGGEKRLIFYDKNGNYTDSVNTEISHYFVRNNCLVIKVTNKNDLILSFESNAIAKQALTKLSDIRKILLLNNNNLTRGSIVPTVNILNRNMQCNDITPSVDNQLAINTLVLHIPLSRIEVIFNNITHVPCGYPDGLIIGCYFVPVEAEGDPSYARLNDGDVQKGDQLYWISSVAGFDIDSSDSLSFEYLF